MTDLEEKLNKLQKEYETACKNIDKNRKKKEKLYEQIHATISEIREAKIDQDPIFLLSKGEYEKYQKKIPIVRCRQWLRSPGMSYQNCASFIFSDGTVSDVGNLVDDEFGIRPALRINPEEWFFRYSDARLNYCGITWIKIDTGFYVAEVPITFRRFDKSSNKYENSEIRNFLLDWYKERKDW